MLDFFAGSGTAGAVAAQLDRRFIMVDNNPEAFEVMRNRLGDGGLLASIRYVDLSADRRSERTVA